MNRTFPRLSRGPNARGVYEILWSEQRGSKWRSRRKSTGTGVRKEAEAALARFLTVEEKMPDAAKRRVRDAWEHYRAFQSIPRGNDKTDGFAMRAPLVAFGDWPALAVTDRHVQTFIAERMKGKHGKKPVSASTVRREVVALQAVLNFASRGGLIPGSPVYRFSKPADGAPRDLWLTEEQQAEILRAAEGWPLSEQVFLRLALAYGARKGAILDLTWDRVSFVAGTIDFRNPHKAPTRKRRPVVPMTQRIRALLKARLSEAGWDARPVEKAAPDRFQRRMGAMGYDWCTPHVLKHSAISSMLRAGTPMMDVAKLTQTDLRTIERVYRHHAQDELRSMVERRGM